MKAIELYIGLDVHKDSTTIAIAEPGTKGEIRLPPERTRIVCTTRS